MYKKILLAFAQVNTTFFKQNYRDEFEHKIQDGFQLFNTLRIGYQFQFFKNLEVYKNNEVENVNLENVYSITFPSSYIKNGLNKFGIWEPNFFIEHENSLDNKISFKIILNDISSISFGLSNNNGSLHLVYLKMKQFLGDY